MKSGSRRVVVGLVAACLVLSACASGSGSGSDDSSILRYGTYEPTSLDPRKSGGLDTLFLEPVYDSLIARTPSGELKPGLATEWKLAEDATVLTMSLRDGVKFQDGTPFDGEAVKANIRSAQELGALRASELEPIESVEVLDPLHIRMNLSEPSSQLIGVLAGEAGMMISPAALKKGNLETKPVGAGPYQLVEYAPGRISYRAWDGYWAKETVKNDGLEFVLNADATTQFRALKSGEIDAQGILASQAKEAKESGLNVLATPTTSLWQVMLNVERPVLRNPKVRQAIMHAVDRRAISDSMTAGTCVPTVQPFGKEIAGHVDALDDPQFGYDVAKAKQLMAEAGFGGGTQLELAVSTSTQQQELGSILQAALAEIGITVKLRVLDQANQTSIRRKGEFDMATSLSPAARPDQVHYISRTYLLGGADNPGNFSVNGIERYLSAARRSDDEKDRGAALQRIVRAVYDAGPPVIPVCSTTFHFAYPDSVSGLQGPALNDFDWASVAVE